MPSSSCADRDGPARLRTLRARRHLTLDALGNRVFVSPATISRWENGLRRPHPSLLPRLADALAVDRHDLVRMFATVRPAASETVHGGAGLRALRHERQVSRRELSDRIGATVATVAHWECGRRRIPVARLPLIAAALNVEVAELARALGRRADPAPRLSGLAALRHRCGLTRVEVARRAGVSARTVSGWENGSTRISWRAAAVLAELFAVTPDDVVDATGSGELAGARRIGEQSPPWARELARAGVTQTEAAAWVGVHRQTMARWERGRTSPGRDQRSRIDELVRRVRSSGPRGRI